jgi:PAS domain S-box-containing protein
MLGTPRQRRGVSYVIVEYLIGLTGLALVTWGAWRLHAHTATMALLYLCFVVVASLRRGLAAGILAGLGATVCLDYFFTPPLLSVAPASARDVVALGVFSAVAVVITRIVSVLRTSEDRWRNVFENNPTMHFIVSDDGVVRSVNPYGAEQLGYTVAELVGRPVLDVFLPEDRASARDHIARCLAHLGQSLSWELRKVRKDGTVLWVRETARGVTQKAGRSVVLVACEDITDRKTTRDQLEASEARLRGQASLLDLTHDTIFVRNMDSVILYWNRGAEEAYGWRADEALGRVTHELLQTVFPEPLETIIAKMLQAGRWDGELVHTTRDGTRIVVASRWSLQRDASGAPIGIMETNNDVTERKRAEGELRRSEAYLAEAQRLAHTGSWAVDHRTGRTVYWSEETYRICGIDPQQLPPDAAESFRLVHPDDRERLARLVDQALRAQTDVVADSRMLLQDGTVRHVHVTGHPVRDDGGSVVEYVGTVVDMTEHKRADEALQRAQGELARAATLTTMGELAASIAHELRQPLAAIVMNGSAALRWLNRESPDLTEARDATSRIVREAQRADGVIRGLRALLSKSEVQRVPLDLNVVVHEMLELVRSELRRHDVSVETELAHDLPLAIGDRVQLQQVLLNLIVNGIEAMAQAAAGSRSLLIRTARAEAGSIAVSVEDTGAGMEAATAERIFDAFFTTKPSGLGMGLAICRSIVEAHGGRLSVAAREPHGAIFRFTVPTAGPVQAPAGQLQELSATESVVRT